VHFESLTFERGSRVSVTDDQMGRDRPTEGRDRQRQAETCCSQQRGLPVNLC